MATGKEIKRLRGKMAAAKVAGLMQVNVDRLRKWEERDADPSDTGDIEKVERFFGVRLSQLSTLQTFDFFKPMSRPRAFANNHAEPDPFREKYLALLEKQVQEKDAVIQQLTGKLTEVEAALNKVEKNLRAMYAFQMGFQDTVLPILGEVGRIKAIQKEAGRKVEAYLRKFQQAESEPFSSLSGS